MRNLLVLLFCCFAVQLFAQEQQLAYQYFRNGDYEKAAAIYKNLQEKHPYNSSYVSYLIDCYQQLENFTEANTLIENQLKNYQNREYLYVDYGYNFQLQHQLEKATFYYEKAFSAIETSKNSSIGYLIGRSFQSNHLLEYALRSYKKAMEVNPNANYNIQIANIYGEKGEVGNMFNTYLDVIETNETFLPTAKNYIGKFITDDDENDYNIALKKLLLKRSQNNPKDSWNQLLSWLFMQQKDYNKALIQEKALHKRNSSDLKDIFEIGKIATENKAYEAANNCFKYVIENSSDTDQILSAKVNSLNIDMETGISIPALEAKYQQLFDQYGKTEKTLFLQLSYADFLTTKKNNPEEAIRVLKDALKLAFTPFQKGYLKIKLADVFVFTNKFNSALIYYTQVQNSLKNHVIGQTARFKIAQTSYYKGDFDWAQSQLKVLKKSTSQLISNDALDLNLLIADNAVKDSLKIALKKYAIADLFSYQNKNQQAIDTLQTVLTQFKGHPIEDEALFKQAKLFEKTNQFDKALNNYLQLIEIDKNDILADDAHYFLAELYSNKYNNTEKAKEYYQKVVFEYPSSIYLVAARKKFRKLRGDIVN